jgi:Outer membrane protein beta-barrel domain
MKRFFLFMLIILVPLLVKGQGVGIGIKAGANFANQDISNIKVETVTDYLVGAYVNVNFSEKWGITPELLYTVYGTKWNNAKVNCDYVAVPLMLRFKPVSLLSLEAGPQFSFLTKAHLEGYGDIKNQLKNNDFGLAFGAGLHLPLGFNVGARYVLGFTDISDVSAESIKNRTFQLTVGWTIFGAK